MTSILYKNIISESNYYFTQMFIILPRSKPIRERNIVGLQPSGRALGESQLKAVYLNSFSLLNSVELIVNKFQFTA